MGARRTRRPYSGKLLINLITCLAITITYRYSEINEIGPLRSVDQTEGMVMPDAGRGLARPMYVRF